MQRRGALDSRVGGVRVSTRDGIVPVLPKKQQGGRRTFVALTEERHFRGSYAVPTLHNSGGRFAGREIGSDLLGVDLVDFDWLPAALVFVGDCRGELCELAWGKGLVANADRLDRVPVVIASPG